jgi:AcrR family transcriptional regulator
MMDTPAKRSPGRPKDEQLSARRTEEILDAAATLFADRGYPNTDMQVVADELGVGKGTIYRYFPTKRDLFLAAVDRVMHRLTEHIDASVTAEDPLEQLDQAVTAYLSFFETNSKYIELIIQERAEFRDRAKPTYFEHCDANIGKWQKALEGLIAAGRVRPWPPEMMTNVVGDLLYGTIFTNYFAGRRSTLQEQADQILEIVRFGVLTDAERAARMSHRAKGKKNKGASSTRGDQEQE